jgi:hypothetical protein
MKAKFDKVNRLFTQIGEKNKQELEHAKIKPIDDSYPFAQNGIHAMVAAPGTGKSYNYIKMAAKQEVLFDEPFFFLVLICSTSSNFDKTVQTFKEAITKTKLVAVKDSELLTWLEEYQKKVLVYNTIMKYVQSDFKKPSEEMMKIIKAKGLHNKTRLLEFIAKALAEIGWKTYPHRLWLILDDFSSHPLLKNKTTQLSMLLKKLRHFNINVTIVVQTTKSITLDIKRILTDCTLFPGISYNDFKDLLKDSTLGFGDVDYLWNQYNQIEDRQTQFTIHASARRVIITPPS